MRKRTQLVGFEFGYWKHSQYLAEFLDNALDAIESFQWNELKKDDSKVKFTLDHELRLENLSILQMEKGKSQPLSDEARYTLKQEVGIEPIESDQLEIRKTEDSVSKFEKINDKSKIEVEEEVKKIIEYMEELIQPVEPIIDKEPIVIIRLREAEAPSFLTSELSQKNVMNYTFEIFDNGTGMLKVDLRKFGKYLASSKSMELKQTRGSQGFGAPSAFSDSQNTTGRPIVAVSKSVENVYATVSEFFTTSKNEKRYVIHPTDVDSSFLHGTYIKLDYLNTKYTRGYTDVYVKETALMNPHITLIYIDPYNEEHIYPRKVSNFPIEPKYAKPHPSSTNIGDLQDLLTKAENHTLSSFLKENFVRISSRTANEILSLAERDLQDKLNLLIFENGFLTIIEKKSEPIFYLRFEKRIFGKSAKERDKLIIYKVNSEELKNNYWELITNYNHLNNNTENIRKQIKRLNIRLDKAETKKQENDIKKELRKLLKDIEEIRNNKDKIKQEFNNLFKNIKNGLVEAKKIKNRSDFEDIINEVQISKTKPSELTNEQFKSLFKAFKSVKYMTPPTDTAIPVGESVLESTLIKELGLKISENLDDFDTPVESFSKTIDVLYEERRKAVIQEDPEVEDEVLDQIRVNEKDLIDLNSLILANMDIREKSLEDDQFKQSISAILTYTDDESINSYGEIFEYFIENFTRHDDFIAAETRDPTSGKGLAFVVEAVLAHSTRIEIPKRSRDVLLRFVNRTPKLRDSADCAITKAVQSVNWKNYKLETYDNNLPKGSIKLLVNVSGPFVHLMFKSQSKNALADDENLIKEIKFCLEAIGRKLRIYLNRRATLHKSEKRASLIEKYIPIFVKSLYTIASEGESKYKDKINERVLADLMRNAIVRKTPPAITKLEVEKPEIAKIEPKKDIIKEKEIEKEVLRKEIVVKLEKIPKKEVVVKKTEPIKEVISAKTLESWTNVKLRNYCKKNNLQIASKIKKEDIISKIQESLKEKPSKVKPKIEKFRPKEPVKFKPLPPGTMKAAKARLQASRGETPSKPKSKTAASKPKVSPLKPKTLPQKPKQTKLPIITTDNIMSVLSKEWQTVKHLIFKLKIRDMMDARYLQIKLKQLEREEKVIVDIKKGKKHWKLK